ncbi:WD repeat-containing protein 74 [Danaus plexippus]|uniref:WD repeat-containing protein 74 n=1 Tax=Danaus plexippus TaxID=13037 RepID=UPI002AB02FAD|nr:WD repeat-containing protein 74 [Danaus plexippus]
MQIKEDKEIDLFVASRIGSFKHIKYHTDPSKNNKKCIENLVDIKTLQKDDNITCMVWGSPEQTDILIGRKTQQIQVYNTLHGFTKSYTADFGSGDVVGLGRHGRRLVAAVSEGVVQVYGKKDNVTYNVGKIDRMKIFDGDTTMFATGGEENDLKVYRIGETEPLFVAKNLPHDWLQLRKAVWVSDLTFLSPSELAVCSRHGYIRLYDTRAQRRPVCNVECDKMAATCISKGFDERQVFVGFGRGQLHQVDLRRGHLDKGYKGAAGAITGVVISHGSVISCSLDRHLRVHRADTKELLYKQYLTSKLSCVLVQTASSTPMKDVQPEMKEELEMKEETALEDLESASEKPQKRSDGEQSQEIDAKKMKPSTEGSTVADDEDAIISLLRSTERQKKKRDKMKKNKKAKSVFHNA